MVWRVVSKEGRLNASWQDSLTAFRISIFEQEVGLVRKVDMEMHCVVE